MASSDQGTSSGSEYQVFLNFRGPDTRVGFTDVLYHYLIDAGICVFRDDEELRVGEKIDGSLQQAIDNCRIYIPIFSPNYASSKWCLCELTQIVTNTFTSKGMKKILPIFFKVKPDDVKLKTPLYRDAILKLEHEKNLSTEQVDTWRKALMEVDAIKGWEVEKCPGHGTVIKSVVEKVLEVLKTKYRMVTEYLVGINDQVEAVHKLLDINSGGVRFIKILGMEGIGKTTLANVIFNELSPHFGIRCCFLENIRAKSSTTDGLVELQRRLLLKVGIAVGTSSIDEIDYGMMRTMEALYSKKVLIVLDDVDTREQVEKLVGKCTFYPGSRILITTTFTDVLPANTPNYHVKDYEMKLMSDSHALELFSRHAFYKSSPSYDYEDISMKIVYATGRLPLALEVIGSFLCQKKQELWIETLEKLSEAPHKNIFEKLKISYDALTYEQQQIFLDIACFFVGEDITNAFYMWEDCKFSPNTGIDVLISRSLLKIVGSKFLMHDQLKIFGREIVRLQDRINPRKRSRIWICEEVLDAIRSDEMNEIVEALHLDIDPLGFHHAAVESREIRRFKYLRFLCLIGGTFVGNLVDHLTKLRWISWNYPRQVYEWTNMDMTDIVVLEFSGIDFLDDSRLQTLIEIARKLKVLSLESCHKITKTPNFSRCPKLERLTFIDCSNLRKIDRSIGSLKKLIALKIDMCFRLEDLPEEIGDLANLEHFFVRCKGLKFPVSISNLKSLRVVFFSGL